jgi:ubiquinone/menaquinone biosynthesis C-methylase UbiE
MKQDFIASLVCPDCGSGFELENVYTRTGNDILNAITRCECSKYPILNGILIYKKSSSHARMASTGYIIERLRMGRADEARALPVKATDREKMLLDLHSFLTSLAGSRRIFNPILKRIRNNRKRTLRKISGSLTFFEIMNLLEPNTWGAYLKHRFSSQTFWSSYPFIPMIEKKNQKVLDMGCGTGHLSFVLSKHMQPENLVCADENYTLLLLAKRFMVKDANFVCLDANNPLPFRDDNFSSIIMMDSFHYISNRARLADELSRMLSQNGLLLQLHLHNVLKNNLSPGFAMSPGSWRGLFSDSSPSVIPETGLVKDFLDKSEIDLTKNYPDNAINSANALSMIVTADKNLIDKYPDLHIYLERFIRNPIINPVYKIHRKGNTIVLERSIPNRMYAEEYPLSLRFLPRRYTIPRMISKSIAGRNIGRLDEEVRNDRAFKDMIRKFVIIDAPRGYV